MKIQKYLNLNVILLVNTVLIIAFQKSLLFLYLKLK